MYGLTGETHRDYIGVENILILRIHVRPSIDVLRCRWFYYSNAI